MNGVERMIARINELGLAMGVEDDELIVEGIMTRLTGDEQEALDHLHPEIIAHLTMPREHIGIICKNRRIDGRACGEIVTVQRATGKLAWCQTCYPPKRSRRRKPTGRGSAPAVCSCCGHRDWWISIYGKRICRVCHPPAFPELESAEKIPACEITEPDQSEPETDDDSIVTNVEHVVLPLRTPGAERAASNPVLYVASDLEHWITDSPHLWAKSVTIAGKPFIRLTPTVLAWLKQRVLHAESRESVSFEQFQRIVRAFTPVYEFAVRVGMVPDPVEGACKREEEIAA